MPVLVYSLLRILLIVIAGAGLYLAGMRGLLLVVGAVLIGAALSYLVLDRYRRASAEWLQARGKGHTKVEDRIEADAEAEDALLDAQDEGAQAPADSDREDAENSASDAADRDGSDSESDGSETSDRQGDGQTKSDQ